MVRAARDLEEMSRKSWLTLSQADSRPRLAAVREDGEVINLDIAFQYRMQELQSSLEHQSINTEAVIE